MSPFVALGLTHLGVAILLIALNLPLLRGKIAMNRWYGFRLPQSYRSNQNWYLINAFGARKMIRACAIMIPFAIVEMLLPIGAQSPVATLCGFAPILFLIGPVISTFKYAKSL